MTADMRPPVDRRVLLVLLSWGVAVLMLAGLLSWWIWSNQRAADRSAAEVRRQQDAAMCAMLDLFTSGPEPVAGPAGDRGRAVLAAMRAYQGTLDCPER